MEQEEYNSIELKLKGVLNNRINQKSIITFKSCLKDFKVLGFALSKEYLKNLIDSSNKAKKSDIVYKLVLRTEIKSYTLNKYVTERTGLGTTKTKKVFNILSV